MAIFPLRRTEVGREPLPVAMSGVRPGERVLQIALDDARIAGAIAAKSGLSGHAAIVVDNDADAARAREGAARQGAPADIHVAPLDALPFEAGSFDTVVIHNLHGSLSRRDADRRQRMLRDVHRVLRPGGRVVVLDVGARSGLAALVRPGPRPDPRYEAEGGSVRLLELAGFKPVRLLAEREGYRFSEGLKAKA